MLIPLDKIPVAEFGRTVCCEYKLCGNPATGIMMPRRIFLCEEHAEMMKYGEFRRFTEGRSLAKILHCTEIEFVRPPADASGTPVRDKSKTSP